MEQAEQSYNEGVFQSIRGCARYYDVTYSTLRKYILNPELNYQGTVPLSEEEKKQVMLLIKES